MGDPVRRVMIPKADGSERPLGIPTIRDRVAQMAVKLVIEPIFESAFCDNSYGFRPKKSAHDAVDDVAHSMNKGYTEVIDADLSKYFDTIPHANLMRVVAERISDSSILHLLDRTWSINQFQRRLGARIVRYADDIVVLCKRGADKPMTELREILDKLKLTLNETKTHVVNTFQERFDFLGFAIWMGKSRKTGNYYSHVQPSKKALKKIKDRITEQTGRYRTIVPLEQAVSEVNSTLRGWVGYFHIRNCAKVLEHVRGHVEQRLRTHHPVGQRRMPYGEEHRKAVCGKTASTV